jgi:hypothetical protein
VSTAVGNGLSNLIIAQGSSNAAIDGDNDVLVGDTGADTFVMDKGYGHEVIYMHIPRSECMCGGQSTAWTAITTIVQSSNLLTSFCRYLSPHKSCKE